MLHVRRKQLGLSESEVATRAGVDKTTVGRWEKEVSLDEHHESIQKGYGYFHTRVVSREAVEKSYDNCAHDAVSVKLLGEFRRPVSGKDEMRITVAEWGLHGARMEPMLITLEPGALSVDGPTPHLGEEILYVLDGKITVEFAMHTDRITGRTGKPRPKIVGTGGLVHLRSEVPHRLVNATKSSVRLLIIKHPPDRYSRCTLEEAANRRKAGGRGPGDDSSATSGAVVRSRDRPN
ncbi:MAG: cupin domain-containing protein [Deltaproteobacteria bacterium]|nr:cupin domain-containing protein [Deltaproteobacteria bacterium]MBI3390348.1 cupin domain-containing protein [Deltaproteobacteria bacterium]